MIRHRPFGRGHAYRIEADQRVPARPIAGEPLELRATTNRAVTAVRLELAEPGGVRSVPAERGSAVPSEATAGGTITASGHLSAAASGAAGLGRLGWVVRMGPQAAGTRLRYRFVADTPGGERRTRWFEIGVSAWMADSGRLDLDAQGNDALAGRLDGASVRWLSGPDGVSRVRLALRLLPGERVMGFGERFDTLDQRRRRLDAVVFEQYKNQGNRTYLPIPFAIVVGGGAGGSAGSWGFHVDTSRRVWFDIGATDPDRLWIEAALDPEREPALTVRLFGGAPSDVLAGFLERTGRPVQPPDWVFRPWMSANEWNTQARVMIEVERSLELGIPVGAVVIEAWSDESTFVAFRDAQYEPHPDGSPHRLADFTFPPDGAWPDPEGLVRWLHERGIALLLWQIPLLRTGGDPTSQLALDRDVMVERGYAVREADGRPYRNRGWWFPGALMPDFTSPAARAWWLEKRRYLVEELGIDGFKTDGGEHAWGHDLRYADGTRGDATNNRYPVQYAAAYHELMRSAGRDPVTFSRAGYTGAATVPLHWAGDEASTWEAFRASITAGLTAGMSGVFFWGWDIGGFSGPIPTAELFLRGAAMAAFCPVMQYHAEFNFHRLPSGDRTPWNIAERTGDERVVPLYRALAELRERLVPYLIEQAARSIAGARPLMRALPFEWPDDARAWDFPFEYLLGDDLLVAPVVEPGATSVRAYLPAGDWVDVWTGETFTGPVEVERAAPLGSIPVFARGSERQRLANVLRRAARSAPPPAARRRLRPARR